MAMVGTEEEEQLEEEEDIVMLNNLTADGSVLKVVREKGYGHAAKFGDLVALRLWVSQVDMAPNGMPHNGNDEPMQVEEDEVVGEDIRQAAASHGVGEGSTCGESQAGDGTRSRIASNTRIACKNRPKRVFKSDGGERPVLVALRQPGAPELSYGAGGDDLDEVLRGVSDQVRRTVLLALDLGVPDMLVGEAACLFVQLQESASVGQNATWCAPMCEQQMTRKKRMVQVEVELLALNMQCITQDGGVLAHFEHVQNTSQCRHDDSRHDDKADDNTQSTKLLHACSNETKKMDDSSKEVSKDAHHQRHLQWRGDDQDEGDQDQAMHTHIRPRAGDIAVVSYVMSYKGQVLMDLSQPHEVILGVPAPQEAFAVDHTSDFPPGLQV